MTRTSHTPELAAPTLAPAQKLNCSATSTNPLVMRSEPQNAMEEAMCDYSLEVIAADQPNLARGMRHISSRATASASLPPATPQQPYAWPVT